MSHVDEGALHAYLDGALEEYPSGQARRIRLHLEHCARCDEALVEARKVRDRAERILASPDLSVTPPPFEELRRLARSSEHRESEPEGRRARPFAHRFGWAASVVLALGVGWILRGGTAVMPERGMDRVLAPVAEETGRPQSPEANVEADARSANDDALAREGAAPADLERAAIPAAPEPLQAPALEVAPVLAAREEEALADDLLSERVASAATAPSASPQPGVELVVEGAPSPDVAGSQPAIGESDRSASLSGIDAPRGALSSRVDAGTGLMGTAAFDRAREAPRSADRVGEGEPGSLVIPGLEVLSIVWREEGTTPAGVRVVQRLEGGGEVELIHLPEGFEPGLLDSAGPGVRELVVPRDQGWLVLRAGVDEDALLDLLRRLDEPPPM